MKDLSPGDKILGPRGHPTVINEVFEEHIPERMYRLKMADGQVIEASGNHLWYCETDTDFDEKKKYIKLAKHYFKRNKIPAINEINAAYPIELMPDKFSNDKKSREFISRACLSLGPTLTTPNVYIDNYLEEVGEELIVLYSFNDMVKFLKEMEKSVKEEEGYFYFGKVRSTDEIFSISLTENINIPEKGDIK